jgi:hypothetical protein
LRACGRKYPPKKRKAARQWNFYRKSRTVGKKVITKLSRGNYFLKWRDERTLLKILSLNPPSHLKELRNKHRAIVRRIYYCIFPRFFSFIVYPPDRELLHDLERHYYNYLLIDRLSRNSEKSNVVFDLPVINRLRSKFYTTVLERQKISGRPRVPKLDQKLY